MSLMPVSGYKDLRVDCENNGHGFFQITYTGRREDLIASGVATAEMLDSIGVKGPRGGRTDADGKRYLLNRQYVTRGGVPVHWYRLRWLDTISRTRMLRMPGALAAVKRSEDAKAMVDWASRDESLEALRPRRAVNAPARGGLRLIVDNTRR